MRRSNFLAAASASFVASDALAADAIAPRRSVSYSLPYSVTAGGETPTFLARAAAGRSSPEATMHALGLRPTVAPMPSPLRWATVSPPAREYAVMRARAPQSLYLWDVAHQLQEASKGKLDFVEPNFYQSLFEVAPPTDCKPDLNATYPPYGSKIGSFWTHDRMHGNFAPDPAAGTGVRVADLGTGYVPHPVFAQTDLQPDLQYDFVANKSGALDPQFPKEKNAGHGTMTLSILCGGPMPGAAPGEVVGGAPAVSAVPLRVADWVVLLWKAQVAAMYNAFNYCLSKTIHGTRFDVVSMSMGGLANQSTADAAYALYEAGVFVVASAGNRNPLTHYIVFPGRLACVVAACGIENDFSPYASGANSSLYGPNSKMRTAMAGWAPNVPYAKAGCETGIIWSGEGTSCATPQIAAAAARYIQAHQNDLKGLKEPWMRAEMVRQALFRSSTQKSNFGRFGQGAVDAGAAVMMRVDPASLVKEPIDDVGNWTWALARLLFGWGDPKQPNDPKKQMLMLEAAQLSQTPDIERILDTASPSNYATTARSIRNLLLSSPFSSETLRTALAAATR